jgi:hypothetical protein
MGFNSRFRTYRMSIIPITVKLRMYNLSTRPTKLLSADSQKTLALFSNWGDFKP